MYLGVNITTQKEVLENSYEIVVDALFGTGLTKELNDETITILKKLTVSSITIS